MSELLPCPFCGGTNLETYGPPYPECAWVHCLDCHATGPQVVNREGADPRPAWNDRAVLPEPEIVHPPMQHIRIIPVKFLPSTPMQPLKLDPDDLIYLDE